MQIKIFGEHFAITDALQNHIETKINHLNIFENTQNVEVRLKTVKAIKIANINLNYKDKNIHIEQKGEDMYAVIDELYHKTQREIIRLKEKHNIHLSS